MRSAVYFIVLILAMVSLSDLMAQQKSGSIVVELFFASASSQQIGNNKGIKMKNGQMLNLYGVEDALVILTTTKGDTVKYITTDERGIATFKNIPFNKYSVSVSYVGMLPVKADIIHNQPTSRADVMMEEGGFLLDEIKVQGKIPLLIAKGDTLVVNPKAVQTQQGAAAIEIVKQVPGVEITSQGSVIAFGEPLKRTYVGGTTLFGRNVLNALINLDADIVKNIKFYDEDEIVSIINGEVQTRKVRVMNVETTRQLLASTTGHFFAGAGKDFKDGSGNDAKLRYKAGGQFNMFTSNMIVKGEALYNNVGLNNSSSADFTALATKKQGSEKELAAANVSVEYNNRESNNVYKTGSTLRLSYNYSNERTTKEKLVERDYFATAECVERLYTKESNDYYLKKGHRVDAYYSNSYKNKWISLYSISHSMSFYNGKNDNMNLQKDISDISSVVLNDKYNENSSNWSISEKAYVSSKRGDRLNIIISAGEYDRKGIQELETNGLETIYKSSPLGRNLSVGATAAIHLYRWKFNTDLKEKSVTASCYLSLGTNYKYGRSQHYRYDVTESADMALDSLSSYSYSNNHWEHSAELMFVSGGTKSVVRNMNLNVGVKRADIRDYNRMLSDNSSKTYVMPTARLSFSLFQFVSLGYSLTPAVPSLEQVRSYVNDNNPLFVEVGNKDLDYTLKHRAYFSITNKNPFSASINFLQFRGQFEVDQNAVVPYSVYYPAGGEVKELQGYTLMPGATLSSYRNVNNNVKGTVDVWYTTRISGIKTKVKVNVGGEYLKRPSYVQDKLNVTDTYSGKFHLNAYSSYKWMTMDLSSTSKYTESQNTIKSNYKYFNQQVKATAKFTILKTWYIDGTYIYSLNKPVCGSSGYTNENNILNASTGVKLFKGRLSAGVSLFDILDRSTDFSTMLYEDYVQNTWTPTFGRYISFDVIYYLRKNKYK